VALAGGIALQHALEIVQQFRRALLREILRAPPRLGFLLAVIKIARDRVMGLVNIHHEVFDRELQLVCHSLAASALGARFNRGPR